MKNTQHEKKNNMNKKQIYKNTFEFTLYWSFPPGHGAFVKYDL